jgi:hypothetical protein
VIYAVYIFAKTATIIIIASIVAIIYTFVILASTAYCITTTKWAFMILTNNTTTNTFVLGYKEGHCFH